MNKRIYWIFTVLVVTGLILVACGTATTEPPEVEQPTEEVAPAAQSFEVQEREIIAPDCQVSVLRIERLPVTRGDFGQERQTDIGYRLGVRHKGN